VRAVHVAIEADDDVPRDRIASKTKARHLAQRSDVLWWARISVPAGWRQYPILPCR
jgi:hypothetical protein